MEKMIEKFEPLVVALRTDDTLHLKVKIYKGDNQITIETGRDIPNRILNKIFNKTDKLGIKYDDICICASTSCNAEIIKSSIIGRPKAQW